ncbi:hypothetical protein [Clostridium sp. Marseille-Q2269]|uniref:hypothetical protein n=1 Tax=Clostridium sp. Marseille-Q2269 TaxID=2942205 RepID=UPI002073A46F|nr:hypothetical protein [Clostridium sp. Marseille-Q2269]
MFKRSSAYKKAICTVVLSVMLQSSFSGFINTVKAFDSPLTTTISTGNGPQSNTSPSSIKFPGTISPGEALASVNENRFALENRGLKINFSKDANGLYGMDYFKNKLTNENYNIKINKLFSIALNASTTISQGDMTIKNKSKLINLKEQPDSIRLSDRDSGKKVSTTFTYSKNGISFDLEWNVILRNNSNNIKQEFIIKCTSGTLDANSIKLVDYTINTSGATPVKDGTDDGSPVTAKDIFVGLENPLSKINVSGNNAEISIPTAIPIKTNESRSFTTGIGVSPSGQIKRAFRYYLERERMHYRRPQLMYNTLVDFPFK